jgi:hypothetical protein
MKISRLWVVTKPNKNSTLEDICFQTDLTEGLCNQYKGGLDPKDIVGFWDDESQAKEKARFLLQRAKIENKEN